MSDVIHIDVEALRRSREEFVKSSESAMERAVAPAVEVVLLPDRRRRPLPSGRPNDDRLR